MSDCVVCEVCGDGRGRRPGTLVQKSYWLQISPKKKAKAAALPLPRRRRTERSGRTRSRDPTDTAKPDAPDVQDGYRGLDNGVSTETLLAPGLREKWGCRNRGQQGSSDPLYSLRRKAEARPVIHDDTSERCGRTSTSFQAEKAGIKKPPDWRSRLLPGAFAEIAKVAGRRGTRRAR